MTESAAEFNVHHAATNLSRIIGRVEHGEEIIISRSGTPVAKVVPLNRRVDRDPFDRILIAQAQLEDLTLMTRDSEIQKYEVDLQVV
ncbi:type II toxin-antitoxin system prevent-host-death family antitoxin [Paractinoplanes durhamensis]|uniref:Antitoxin n=1 Tax=Paractinoplanes durhamensis TaxID=113563 RepID=A0ABQ3YYE7_9ACTN|nr:type II toxin-antitoxin system prevent-host-death family antitoxin [Actinoplanes durhamensis]GIE02598.1 hypothetical protein Adu01nite_39480 [Actinoplanes durhamensis]